MLGKSGTLRQWDAEFGSLIEMKSFVARMVVLASAASLTVSAPAAAAARTASAAYSPWAALSAFASPASSQALCGSAATAAASAAATASAQGTPGCLFPVVDAPVAPPVSETAPLATPAAVAAGSGIGVLPLLLGLAALGGAAALLLSNGNGSDQISVSP
jgi:hypothetical protein